MRRRRPNPFTVLLGVVGIAFTLTASAFCIAVLRGGAHTGAKPGQVVRGPGYRP